MSNCHDCRFSKNIPGDCHIACGALINDKAASLLAIHLMIGNYNCVKETMGISFNPHGVQSGWCNFPFNYDPVWIEGDCKIKVMNSDKIEVVNE